MIYHHVFQRCSPQSQSIADGIDNDCDGNIDEEPCDGEGMINIA